MQLFPARAVPGLVQVTVSGDSSRGDPVVAGPSGTPFGSNGSAPQGRDGVFTFRVNGIEGGPAARTPPRPLDLGDVTGSGLVQVGGVIGGDPFFDPGDPDPSRNPGNGVVMYHFHVSGAGRYAFLAEVFAGRIGSPLDAGVALYRLDPTTGACDSSRGTTTPATPRRRRTGRPRCRRTRPCSPA